MLEVSAGRYPEKPFCRFFGGMLTYREALAQAERLVDEVRRSCRID